MTRFLSMRPACLELCSRVSHGMCPSPGQPTCVGEPRHLGVPVEQTGPSSGTQAPPAPPFLQLAGCRVVI